MLCLHYMENKWGLYHAREFSTLPSDLPFRKVCAPYHYVTLVPAYDYSLPTITLSPDIFHQQSIVIPKSVEDRLILN